MSRCAHPPRFLSGAAFSAQNASRWQSFQWHHSPGSRYQNRGIKSTTNPGKLNSDINNTPPIKRIGAQNSLPAAYYRGGTSRAVFFQRRNLPEDKTQWAQIFLGVIGSPDPTYGRQLDGMGGGISSLSKICIVGPPSPDDPDADVEYTFVALGVRDASVDYSSNCGNMSAAVGPFAVDSGLVKLKNPHSQQNANGSALTTVRIRNTNTGKLIHATFPVVDGEATADGDYSIDGVAGTAARVQLDFLRPGGSRTGRLLPTGNATDLIRIAGGGGGAGGEVRATLIDAGNPCCFVLASDLNVDGTMSAQQIDEDAGLKARLEAIRREAAVAMGLAKTTDDAIPGSVPKIGFVSKPKGDDAASSGGNVVVRAMSVGQPHKAVPVTVALAVAAASKIPGTTVADCVLVEPGSEERRGIDISHVSGRLNVDAVYDDRGDLEAATVFRTARRLMEGRVFWK